MTSTLRTFFHWSVFVAGSFSFLFISSVSFSAGHNKSEVTVISCPEKIENLRLNYTTKYTPPTGWGHADAQAIRTKGGVHPSLTLMLNGYQINNRNLICRYGFGSDDNQMNLASIKRPIPKGASCKVGEKNFECTGMNK